jgi:hypothetical protein
LDEAYGLFANRPFFIRSRLPDKRMAECQGNRDVRQRAFRQGETSQQWVFDPIKKVIRSKKWNDRVLETSNHAHGRGSMRCYTESGRWWSTWKYSDSYIVNGKFNNNAMEVQHNKDNEN